MTTTELKEYILKAVENGNQSINLSKKGIIELPKEIGLLKNLGTLDLSGNNITRLPKEIGNLLNLRDLNLKDNELFDLPDAIGNLENLDSIHLNSNLFREFPRQLYDLKKLKHICIAANFISKIGDDISRLTLLRDIQLSSNKIEVFPLGLTKIIGLKKISIERNLLRSIPIEVTQMNNLDELLILHNSTSIPPEVIARGTRFIFNHLKKLDAAKNKKFFNEAKLIFVGDGNVGKTSLVRLLQGSKFNRGQEKTEGIAIKKWSVKLDSEREVSVNIWDFGGQEIMHATHQFFLTQRSVYVLVLNTREEDRYGMIDYWLKMIRSYGVDSPVILALNKFDEHNTDVDRRGLQKKYNIHGFVSTSCKTGKGKSELIDLIKDAIGSLEHTKIEWVDNELKVKQRLEDMKYDFISYDMYEKLCNEEGVSDNKNLIKFLHDLGIVLNFHDDNRLNSTNILNPEWVTTGVYKILNYKNLAGKKGILDVSLVPKILDPKQYPKDKHFFILDMMKKFELCFDIEGSNSKSMLIPELLPIQEPDFEWNSDGNLIFQYKYEFLTSNILSRFIVKVHSFIDNNIYWKNGVVLIKDGNRSLIKADREERIITIYVSGNKNTMRDALSQIRAQFDAIHASNTPKPIEMIPIYGIANEFVDYRYLLHLERNGEISYITKEGNKVKISDLLDGINTTQDKEQMFTENSKMPQINNNFQPNIIITNNNNSNDDSSANNATAPMLKTPWYKKTWLFIAGTVAFFSGTIAIVNNSYSLSEKFTKQQKDKQESAKRDSLKIIKKMP